MNLSVVPLDDGEGDLVSDFLFILTKVQCIGNRMYVPVAATIEHDENATVKPESDLASSGIHLHNCNSVATPFAGILARAAAMSSTTTTGVGRGFDCGDSL